MKKILTLIFAGMFVIVLAGCGNGHAPVKNTPQNNERMKNEQSAQSAPTKKMPEATGKVDDTVNAIISGATDESAQVTSTDADAAAAVGDGTDTNNLNSTYDQNAL